MVNFRKTFFFLGDSILYPQTSSLHLTALLKQSITKASCLREICSINTFPPSHRPCVSHIWHQSHKSIVCLLWSSQGMCWMVIIEDSLKTFSDYQYVFIQHPFKISSLYKVMFVTEGRPCRDGAHTLYLGLLHSLLLGFIE